MTASNEYRNEVINQIGYMIQISGSGTILRHDGKDFVAVKVEKIGNVHTFVTVGDKMIINQNIARVVDAVLVALGYRLY